MRKILTSITVLFAAAVLFSSCSKEVRLAKDLEGDWKVVTYEFNGDNFISFVNSFDMTYNEYDKGASEGTFTWVIEDLNGDDDVTTGEYIINDDGTQIDFIVDNEISTFDITIDGNVLSMNGTIDGDTYAVEANRE